MRLAILALPLASPPPKYLQTFTSTASSFYIHDQPPRQLDLTSKSSTIRNSLLWHLVLQPLRTASQPTLASPNIHLRTRYQRSGKCRENCWTPLFTALRSSIRTDKVTVQGSRMTGTGLEKARRVSDIAYLSLLPFRVPTRSKYSQLSRLAKNYHA